MKQKWRSRFAQFKNLLARRRQPLRLTPEEEAAWDEYLLHKDIEEAYEDDDRFEHEMRDDDYEQQVLEDEQDELYRLQREQSCAWGGDFTLHYVDPLIGPTSLTMFEGEWKWAFEEMRRTKSVPKETIDKLEQMFEEERDSYYADFQDDSDF